MRFSMTILGPLTLILTCALSGAMETYNPLTEFEGAYAQEFRTWAKTKSACLEQSEGGATWVEGRCVSNTLHLRLSGPTQFDLSLSTLREDGRRCEIRARLTALKGQLVSTTNAVSSDSAQGAMTEIPYAFHLLQTKNGFTLIKECESNDAVCEAAICVDASHTEFVKLTR